MTHATYVLGFIDCYRHEKSWSYCTTFFIKTVLLYFIKILMKARKRLWNVPTAHGTDKIYFMALLFDNDALNSLQRTLEVGTRTRSIARIISEMLCNARDWKPTSSFNSLRIQLHNALFVEIILLYIILSLI